MTQYLEDMFKNLDKEDFLKWLVDNGELNKWEAALENKDNFAGVDYIKWRYYSDYVTITILNYKNNVANINTQQTTQLLKPQLNMSSNSTLYSKCCSKEPHIRKRGGVEYYECPYCKQECEVEWVEDDKT